MAYMLYTAMLLFALFPVSALVATGRHLRAAVFQGAAATGNVPANVAHVTAELAVAQESGVDLLLFPELFLHGYDATHEQLQQIALPQDAPALRAIGAAAANAGVCVGIPYCERCPVNATRLYNSMAVFDATGAMVRNYRKVNLWGAWEARVFERGEPGQFAPFDLTLRSKVRVRCGCLICFDIEFPEPSRSLAMQGAELLLVPTALGAGDVEDTTPCA